MKLSGGQGIVELLSDGSMKVTLTYCFGFGIQLPPNAVIQAEETFRPSDKLTDEKQMELMAIAEKWKAGA